MYNPENDFPPLLVDQQIEDPITLLPRGEARLVHDLQAMYDQEKHATIDRVWTRLANRQAEQHTLLHLNQHVERKPVNMPETTISLQQKREPRQAKTFVRRVELLVALLLVTLLIGGLAVVLDLSHWGTATGGPLPTASGWGKIAHIQTMRDFGFNGLAWSPDSKRVAASTRATASTSEIRVRIWDAATGQHLVNVPVEDFVNTLSWSPNSQQVAIATIKNIIIVDGQTGHVLRTLAIPNALTLQRPAPVSSGMTPLSSRFPASGGPGLRAISWSPDGSQIAASFFGDVQGSSVVVWNLRTGVLDLALPVGSNRGIEGVSWSPDGKYIAADTFPIAGVDPLSQRGVIVWSVATRQVMFQKNTGSLPDVNVVVAWQPGTHNLAQIGVVKSGSDYKTAILIFDGVTGRTLKTIITPVSDVLTWSPDGKYLAYTNPANLEKGNAAKILATSNWRAVYTYRNGKNTINELAWSPDGHYIATGESTFVGNASSGAVSVWTALD